MTRWWHLTLSALLGMVATPLAAAPDAHATAARLHRGVNVLGYDPIWKDPARARFQPKHFAIIRQGGFDFIRLVLQAFDHMDAQNQLDPAWLATLDRVIAQARAAGLSIIIDEHDFDKCSKDPEGCTPRLKAFWQQVGARYRGQPDSVLFELLNEPHDKLNGAPWNDLIAQLVPIVRATNPTRTLVIGPTHWNSLKDLPGLTLPPTDRNILVTFHYYEPFRFTHQGAGWTDMKDVHGVPLTAADETRIAADFDTVAAWSKANDRPVMLGEFGAYDGGGTPIADRARYDRIVRQNAEKHGFPWAYWQFDSDFVVYDIPGDHWVEPIHQALIGSPYRPPLGLSRSSHCLLRAYLARLRETTRDGRETPMARIIVADDDELVGEMVCDALIGAGHSAGYVTNGKDALRLIKERRPDLLVLDCNMPELSGLLLLRELKESSTLCDIPVLILSGRRGEQDVNLAYYAGADDYVKKPFEPEEVAFRVDQLLAKHAPPVARPARPAAIGFGRRRTS